MQAKGKSGRAEKAAGEKGQDAAGRTADAPAAEAGLAGGEGPVQAAEAGRDVRGEAPDGGAAPEVTRVQEPPAGGAGEAPVPSAAPQVLCEESAVSTPGDIGAPSLTTASFEEPPGNRERRDAACESAGADTPPDNAHPRCSEPVSRDAADACADRADEEVAQAQDCLAGGWAQMGTGEVECDPEEFDEEGDLGRFDVHDPHQLGQLGEHIAARYLRGYGYTILERNYRTEYGEADLICSKDDGIVLVEVKTRLGAEALPEEAVTEQKIRRYRRITLAYLLGHEWFDSVRFDVLALNIVKPRRAQVHHFMGVCEWEG